MILHPRYKGHQPQQYSNLIAFSEANKHKEREIVVTSVTSLRDQIIFIVYVRT